MLNPLLAGLLHDDELVYRILGDETYVCVSVEIAHTFSIKFVISKELGAASLDFPKE